MDQPYAGSSGYHLPQKRPCIFPVGTNPDTQGDESQFDYISQYLQDSGSNPAPVSNLNGPSSEVGYPNSGFDLGYNAITISNSDTLGSGQPWQGDTLNETAMGRYQSSSSGNLTTRCLPSNQPQPVEIPDDNPTLNTVNTFVAQNQQNGHARSIEEQFCQRLYESLLSGLSTSSSPLRDILMLCSKVSKFLEDNSKCEALENFTKLLETPDHNVKYQRIGKKLRNKFRSWLFLMIGERHEGECDTGAGKLDDEGQSVLHLLAALGYNWAIKSILKARIIDINSPDRNQDTALDWALLMRRNDTVELLKSNGATPRSARKPFTAVNAIRREPIPTCPGVVISDSKRIQQKAKSQWLTDSDILGILRNHQQYTLEPRYPPTNGSLFLLNKNTLRNLRADGLSWKKETRNNSTKAKESEFSTTYAHGKENNPLTKRWYKLRKEPPSNTVLVHYLEAPRSSSTQRPNGTGDHNSDDNPDLGREPDDNAPDRRPAVNQTSESNGVNQMHQPIAGGLQNCSLNGPDRLLLQDTLWDVTFTECSSVSSCDGNLHEEDNDNYSSSKQLVPDGLTHDGFEMIDNPDCCTSNRLEDVTEKTMQPCLDAHKGTVGSADGDEECTTGKLIFPSANTGRVTDPTPKYSLGGTPEDLASSSRRKDISCYLAESITLQSSWSDRGKAVTTVSKQPATPIGYDGREFGLSDDLALSKKAGQDIELVHAAAVRIQNKFRSWKARKAYLLILQLIIKIQAHVRGHQIRLKKALSWRESLVEYPKVTDENVVSEVPEIKASNSSSKHRSNLTKCHNSDEPYRYPPFGRPAMNQGDNANYSSSKQLPLHGFALNDFVMVDSLDCHTSNQLEEVTEKTIQPCLAANKGTTGSEDGEEERTVDMLIFPGANNGLVPDPTPKYPSGRTPKDLASSSGQKGISDSDFGLSDDHALALPPLRTEKAGQESELVHAAAVRIQSKFRSWKTRKDFLLTQQQIIKIQAQVRGHLVRMKKALAWGESMVDYPKMRVIKGAQGSTMLCKAHDGGKQCQQPRCTKSAGGSSKPSPMLKKEDDGGKQCQHPRCTKAAGGSTMLCKAHGGGKPFLGAKIRRKRDLGTTYYPCGGSKQLDEAHGGRKPSLGTTYDHYGGSKQLDGDNRNIHGGRKPSLGTTDDLFGGSIQLDGDNHNAHGGHKPSLGTTYHSYGGSKQLDRDKYSIYGDNKNLDGDNRNAHGGRKPSLGKTYHPYGGSKQLDGDNRKAHGGRKGAHFFL